MAAKLLAFAAAIYGASATIVSPAVGVAPPKGPVHLIPDGSSSQYVNANGDLATLPITPVGAPYVATNFTVTAIPVTSISGAGYFGLSTSAGPCTVIGNAAGGRFVCGAASVTGLSAGQITAFQAYVIPAATINDPGMHLSLVNGGEHWYAIPSPADVYPPPAAPVYNQGPSSSTTPPLDPFDIILVSV